MKRRCLLALLVGILGAGGADAATRIKDITASRACATTS